MRLLKLSNLKKKIKKKITNKAFASVRKKQSNHSRKNKIDTVNFCEDNIRKNIHRLLKEGKTAEEIVGFNTSLLVCLTSSEVIKQKNEKR